jgi:UDP-N-acetylmuramoylalanine-D-glutamate ligase
MALQSLYGVDYDRSVLNIVKPVAHRLSPILLADGITIIDDSVSSSSHALCAAIDAMKSPCVLIAG